MIFTVPGFLWKTLYQGIVSIDAAWCYTIGAYGQCVNRGFSYYLVRSNK